jgi:hypothetical protein
MDWMDDFSSLHHLELDLAKRYPRWTELVSPSPDLADKFDRLDKATEGEVVAAGKWFAETGAWPAMSPAVGAMMRARIGAAIELTETMTFVAASRKMKPPRNLRWPDKLGWYLVQAWEHVGFGHIHALLESLPPAPAGDVPPTNPSAALN